MKTRFSTFDIVSIATELQRLIGMRVAQVYDIDNKTFLIKLQRPEEKCVLLLESGNRIHTTGFEWPKNVAPSGFSMKMRKHLRNKRLEYLKQLGMDRILDLQFGTEQAAYHIILEMYDRGNIVLTDCDMTILYILRRHVENEDVKFAIKEKYPMNRARTHEGAPSLEKLQSVFASAKEGDNLKKILNTNLEYGPAVIEHVLLRGGFPSGCKFGKNFNVTEDLPKLCEALTEAEKLMENAARQVSKGYILQKKEKRPLPDGGEEDFFTNIEFHPMIFEQHSNQPHKEFPTFDAAVDEFFSTLEGQKIDMKALQMEREAMKKLANVRKDHDQRLQALEQTQELDKQRAELITRNQQLVDDAIMAIRAALANQMSWPDIQAMVTELQNRQHPVACAIKGLKLQINHITLHLSDPYADEDYSDDESRDEVLKPMTIDVDLDLSAYSNARRYYEQKRNAAKKQQKTIESHSKALKSAERKTKQTLKEVQAMVNISKARKVYWFEKFHWFISSENYLVIGGRDPKQNELIVKRYMRQGDIYVHADVQGASSIVIKNPSGQPVPPKTLNEAGIMAMCYSVAWDAKVVTSAWWVHSDQVSKTAPTGEYLTTGAFMIRGKKNFLPPSHLIMGFSFLFKLEDDSIQRHKDERKVRNVEDDAISAVTDISAEQDQEIELVDSDDEGDGDNSHEKHDEAVSQENNEDAEDLQADESTKEIEAVEAAKGDMNDSDAPNEEDNAEGQPMFPDVELKIEHSLNRLNLHVVNKPQNGVNDTDDQKMASRHQNRKQKPTQQKNEVAEDSDSKSGNKSQQQLKRGQRAKLKKIKEKYKDQDEEERKLRMEILQSAGSPKDSKKGKKSAKDAKGKNQKSKGTNGVVTSAERQQAEQKSRPRPAPKPSNQEHGGDESDGGGGGAAEEVEVTAAAEVDMLDSLTGFPLPEDELLFAVPVVAPYTTLLNYKFKVKITPGTGKRGKAAKTALNVFLKDHTTTAREKDLIKSVKDEDLSRNIPGKVKISAPQLQKLRK
ncbi:ribosome quality control complex subunit NEMF-like [Schistocerca serialis cubense]|uniref:ribosome quality control complex subunit NEMF-like n=1 Tax=Schistocerca serialis cubense TaxID=2023355 RepID=UPI00214E3950|nr:ribosome quality control complex subunit NEMF-like [Schistocerca serialis cubense]